MYMDVGIQGEDRTADTPISEAEFPLSNLLVVMVLDSFEAVIDAPETAILAVGRVRVVPGAVDWRAGTALCNIGYTLGGLSGDRRGPVLAGPPGSAPRLRVVALKRKALREG